MAGVPSEVLFRVCQIRTEFADDVGNVRTGTGTGFWVATPRATNFITNAHNLDPQLLFKGAQIYRLHRLWIQLRYKIGSMFFNTHEMTEVDLSSTNIRPHPTADVAAIINPTFIDQRPNFGFTSFSLLNLATVDLFKDKLEVMDAASFIGFPGRKGKPWWDERCTLPIARTVNIASWPREPFINSAIQTSDALLVSGLSFSGSSGSPVFSHEKSHATGTGGTATYVPSMLIGIMSGHWDEEREGDHFRHSGLSYLTRSPAIRELISDDEK